MGVWLSEAPHFHPMNSFHAECYHLGVNRNDEQLSTQSHQLWIRALNSADDARMFVCRPDTWADCTKYIPQVAQVHIQESFTVHESVMHEAIVRQVKLDPSFQSEVVHANPFPLACLLIGCVSFLTQDHNATNRLRQPRVTTGTFGSD